MSPLHRRAALVGVGLLLTGRAVAQVRMPLLQILSDGGLVLLIRHALAPGTGDPPRFRLGDCSTQRNLSPEGRREAATIGERLRHADVPVSEVRSSRWCRAMDTAALAFPDRPVTPDAALDSFFGDPASGAPQTEKVRERIAAWRGRQGVLALVTHQVNVTALTGVVPVEGQIVVLRPEIAGFTIVGRAAL